MPFVIPVNLCREFRMLVVCVLLDLLGIVLTWGAFERQNWRWFAAFLAFTAVMFLATAIQRAFIRRVMEDF